MATYSELFDLFGNAELRNRVEVAIIIAADSLADTPDNNAWVAEAYQNTREEALKALMAVLAKNNNATVAQIVGASDTALQTNVDAVVATLVKAKAGL